MPLYPTGFSHVVLGMELMSSCNSCPHAYRARTLMMEPSPWPGRPMFELTAGNVRSRKGQFPESHCSTLYRLGEQILPTAVSLPTCVRQHMQVHQHKIAFTARATHPDPQRKSWGYELRWTLWLELLQSVVTMSDNWVSLWLTSGGSCFPLG